jgi:predicted metal-binding membrane protein
MVLQRQWVAGSGLVLFLLGYFIVWVGFTAVIAATEVFGYDRCSWCAWRLRHRFGSPLHCAVSLALFQFSRAKEICHGVCRSILSEHWKTGFRGGLHAWVSASARFASACCYKGVHGLGFRWRH